MKRLLRISSCIAFMVLALGSCARQASGPRGFDWPRWRGPEGNGISRETDWDPGALAGAPRILWERDVGQGHSNVAIQGGRLYAFGYDTRKAVLVARSLDASTGRVIWKREFPAPQTSTLPQATPSVGGEDLFLLDNAGVLRCLEAKNGKLRWQKDIVTEYGARTPYYRFAGSPFIVDELVILTANSTGMALDRKTGSLVWTSDPPPVDFPGADSENTGVYYSTPVLYQLDGKLHAIVSGWEGLSAVDVRTGTRSWLIPWTGKGWAGVPDPVVTADGDVLTFPFGEKGENEIALFGPGKDGAVTRWRTSYSTLHLMATPVIIDGMICNGDDNGRFRCLDVQTGRQLGKPAPRDTRGGSTPSLSVTAAGGWLILLSSRGVVHVGRPTQEGFRETAQCDVFAGKGVPRTFWTPPVLCNAKLYLRSFGGEITCLDVSSESQDRR
jgi:outer membrane protein assembly factor BamB